MLFFGTKIPTTKHEIMLHAMLLKGGIKDVNKLRSCILTAWDELDRRITLLIWQSGSGARIFLHVLKRKADISNTN